MPGALDEQMILETAAREFAKHGYEGVGMRELCETCGISTQILYYRFTSKEALYREACEYALDAFFDGVKRRLSSAPPTDRSPEALAAAFFDTWVHDSTPLLLTNRDVITALVHPDKRLTTKHYPRVIRLIVELASEHFHRKIDDTAAFCFTAVTFGFSSMMIIDEQNQQTLNQLPDQAAHARYLSRMKATLVALCVGLWAAIEDVSATNTHG